jgi:hypothetical protein
LATLKVGLDFLTHHSEAMTTAIDQSTKKALAGCILSMTKLKGTLKLDDDQNIQNVLSIVNLPLT